MNAVCKRIEIFWVYIILKKCLKIYTNDENVPNEKFGTPSLAASQTTKARPWSRFHPPVLDIIYIIMFLVARMLLVVRPGAPRSVLVPSSDALCS